jgi:hypothetical protein
MVLGVGSQPDGEKVRALDYIYRSTKMDQRQTNNLPSSSPLLPHPSLLSLLPHPLTHASTIIGSATTPVDCPDPTSSILIANSIALSLAF